MSTILVLGSTGMLGSTVVKHLHNQGFKIVEGNRSGKSVVPKTGIYKMDVDSSIDLEKIVIEKKIDYIVNCIGLIKQLIVESDPKSVSSAIKINSEFPNKLEKLANKYSVNVIQIATDCVYSGEKGDYSEDDLYSPIDAYGMTKSLGELNCPSSMILRCSIIGPEISSNNSLLSWFLSRPLKDKIEGYTNHYWNGLTTLHFARILEGIISRNLFKSGISHVVPTDVKSKNDLIKLFAKYFNRPDIEISQIRAPKTVNRTLVTTKPWQNLELWQMAGYNIPPTIEQMIAELASWLANPSEGAI